MFRLKFDSLAGQEYFEYANTMDEVIEVIKSKCEISNEDEEFIRLNWEFTYGVDNFFHVLIEENQ